MEMRAKHQIGIEIRYVQSKANIADIPTRCVDAEAQLGARLPSPVFLPPVLPEFVHSIWSLGHNETV